MGAENLPVNPMQPKMEVVILPDHVLEIMPYVVRGVSLNELCERFCMSRGGMKRRLRKVYQAFKVKSRWELVLKSNSDGLQYRGSSSSSVIYFAETTIRERSL